jgi:riboflavin synthase
MFTGIVEEIGHIKAMPPAGASGRLTIACRKVLGSDDGSPRRTMIGDSICVNGICLTVTSMTSDSFTADVMPETISRSSLSQLTAGSPVDLERAMPAYGRFGGHFVSGHIDGTGTIREKHSDENAVWYDIDCPSPLWKQIVEKGSIAIDGISLTVAKADVKNSFSVSVIPHTLSETVLAEKGPGDIVNLETDMLGKYVEKLLASGSADDSGPDIEEIKARDKRLAELL